MNDAELIALLRERVTCLETAVSDYYEAMEPISIACRDAYEAAIKHPDPLKAEKFLATYQRMLPARQAAGKALMASLQTSFKMAVLTGADWTDEQRKHWLDVCEKDAGDALVEEAQRQQHKREKA